MMIGGIDLRERAKRGAADNRRLAYSEAKSGRMLAYGEAGRHGFWAVTAGYSFKRVPAPTERAGDRPAPPC